MTYRLVIFDFDGTLADSAAWFRGVLNEVAGRYRFRHLGDDEIEMLRGCDNREIIRYLGVSVWKMPFIAHHMRTLIARDADRIALFPGVDDLLKQLSHRGLSLAVVSSNSESNIRRILGPQNAALISFYECGASIFGKPAKFRKVLKRSGIARDRTICIGDETRDIDAARSENLAFGAVTWGYATPDLLKAQAPTMVFTTLDEIVKKISPEAKGSIEETMS
jgi:phosphoglycolate phosphatase